MPSHAAGHVALASSVLVALAIAACGGGEGPGPNVPTSPSASASATGPTAPGTAAVPGSAPAPTSVAPPPSGPMKAVAASAMAEDLKKLGIDPLKPPPLNKLSPDVVRKLMPTFAKSLGIKCEGCHDTNNFKAWTPKKKIASQMWQHFVVDLAMDDANAPLYCDSCHGGKSQYLDRHDKKALSAWMEANFVQKLKKRDKKDHTCETCHGDPFEGQFLKQWAEAK